MRNNHHSRQVLVLMPAESRHGVSKTTFKKKRRPQSAKARLSKNYSVSRLHQNFGSMYVSKIPFKEHHSRFNKPKKAPASSGYNYPRMVHNHIRRYDSKPQLFQETMWSPEIATVEMDNNNNTNTTYVKLSKKMERNKQSSSLNALYRVIVKDPSEGNTSKQRKKSNNNVMNESLKNLGDKRTAYSVSPFPLRRPKKVYTKLRSNLYSNNEKHDQYNNADRALRVGNFDKPYPTKSALAKKLKRSPDFFLSPHQMVQSKRTDMPSGKPSYTIGNRSKDPTRTLTLNIRMPNENQDEDNNGYGNTNIDINGLEYDSNSIMNNNNFNLNGWDNNDKSQEFPQKIASRMDIMFQEPHVEVEKEEEAMLSMRNRQPYQHNLFQRNSFHRKRTRRPRSAGMKRSSRNLRRNSRPKSASLRRRRKK